MQQVQESIINPFHENVYQPIQQTVNPPVQNFLTSIFGETKPQQPDQIGMVILKLVLILYSSMIAPKLPIYVLKWFDYVPFKILVLFLIAWSGSHNPALSLLIAVSFYASLNALNGKQFFENFENSGSLADEGNSLGFFEEPLDEEMEAKAEEELQEDSEDPAGSGFPTEDLAYMPPPQSTDAPTFYDEEF